MPTKAVLDVIATWRAHMADIRAMLTSDRASVRIVLTPENVVIAEARRILTSLSLHGYAVDAVVVNRVIPIDDDPWRAAWNTAQAAGITTITESFQGTPVLTAPYLAGEPTGADALAELAGQTTALDGELPPLDAAVRSQGLRVEADGAEFVLILPLPLARSGDVDLARRADDLVVDVGGVRRVIALPSVLRRCIVKNAGVRSGELRVRFVRDEEVWPRGR
jgi:arsenite-transporting ATPase